MNRIDPIDFFRRLGGLDIQVNDNGILTAADNHATGGDRTFRAKCGGDQPGSRLQQGSALLAFSYD